MKYFGLILLLAVVVFVACSKTNSTTTSVLFYNGSWSQDALTASWNGNSIVSSPIARGNSSVTADSAYIQVAAGTNLLTLKLGSATLLDKNIYSMAAAATSFIVFDTGKTTASVGILQLTDDISKPDTGKIKFRLINLVPDANVAVDIWMVKGTTDSIRLDSANTFIGATTLAAAVQPFDSTAFPGGNYTVKVKKTRTQEVYASVVNYPFAVQGVYSIIFSGLLTGTGSTGFKLSVLRHHIP